MKQYMIFERITNPLGQEYDNLVDVIEAKTAKAAVNKANEMYKTQNENSGNFWARSIC